MKNVVLAVGLVVLGAAGAFAYLRLNPSSREGRTASRPGFCARHQIAENDCPWCDPSLIEKKGQCAGCGVPEALCTQCNPALIPGFKAENDWCAGHGVPESQCVPCKGEQCPTGEKQ